MQALYFCVPFREQLLEYYANNKNIGDIEENLLTCLADLFTQVITLWDGVWMLLLSSDQVRPTMKFFSSC